MTRGAAPLLLLLPALVLASCEGRPSAGAGSPPEGAPDDAVPDSVLVERARGIHERVLTMDTHVDIRTSNFTAERNYTRDLPTQVDLPSLEAGGLDVAWLVVYTGQGPLTPRGYAAAYENALDKFSAIHRLVDSLAPDRVGLATTAREARQIHADGRTGVMIGVENAYPVGTDLSRIAEFHQRGARYMSLSHNGHNQFSDSNTGERDGEWMHGDGETTGLSELGREAVAEMNRVGMMIDVSHPSRGAFMEMARLSRAPLMASHSSARALNDHPRNLDDEQIRAVAEGGGVVQAVAFRSYLDAGKHTTWRDAVRSLEEEVAAETGFQRLSRDSVRALDQEARSAYLEGLDTLRARVEPRLHEVALEAPPVDVADLVDHVDYMVELVGIDHVGISSDFDGGGGVEGWDDASETFNVTLELVRRGYTEEEIAKLWSGNLLRVLEEAAEVARGIQAEEASAAAPLPTSVAVRGAAGPAPGGG